ncbi:MAG: branched-chain amino acid ABC transporter ATP-binding protein/permease [Rhodospirillaceae bacterium]|nr:branched-chain amino acid ABC transporter ATP-binding protein/permease [Rhodospirillaceae bacterium]
MNPLYAAGAVFLVVYAQVFANSYDQRVLAIAGIYALLVIGYQFVFGHAGALSLAQAAFFGLGAYVTALLATRLGWPFLVTFPASLGAAAALAALVALPVLRLESHYFALATLAIGQAALAAAVNWESLTGGSVGLGGVPPPSLFGFAIAPGTRMLVLIWGLVAIGGAVAWLLIRGPRGLAIRAAREAPMAAGAVGIDTGRMRFTLFVLGAAYGGGAGALHAHLLGVVSPEVLRLPVMVSCLAMTIIGGRTRVAGAIIGALLLVHLPEWFRFAERYGPLVYGLALLATIVVAPDGLTGAATRLRQFLWPESPPPPPEILPRAVGLFHAPAEIDLKVIELSKQFGGVAAVREVSFALRGGEIIGLIGPNGSGKTTILNLITGTERPDGGKIVLNGEDIAGWNPHRIARRGIGRAFQTPILVESMTALDNVALATHTAVTAGLSYPGRRLAAARAEAASLLGGLEIESSAMQRWAADLPHGVRRRVEIARALAARPRILVLDEPAAGLDEAERNALRTALRDLAAQGMALIVIEHDFHFLSGLASRLICLDAGQVIAQGTVEAVRRDKLVEAAFFGPTAGADGAP